MSGSKDIWVVLEESAGKVKDISREALNAAGRLVAQSGGEVVAVWLGTVAGDIEDQLKNSPCQRILFLKNSKFKEFNGLLYCDGLVPVLERERPLAVLMGASIHGKELLPQLAARLGAGLATDCIELDYIDSHLEVTRPVYAGKALSRLRFKGNSPFLVSVRANLFRGGGSTSGSEASLSVEEVEVSESVQRLEFMEKRGEQGLQDITEARVVVSGGMGMQGPDNFPVLEELAVVLDGAVGASRPVVDEGWRPYSNQVGQTGRTVSPNLYIACGISGAVQHLAGMSSSQCIVAINKDASAPIFDVADYGIVGDALEIIPILTAELKKTLGS